MVEFTHEDNLSCSACQTLSCQKNNIQIASGNRWLRTRNANYTSCFMARERLVTDLDNVLETGIFNVFALMSFFLPDDDGRRVA